MEEKTLIKSEKYSDKVFYVGIAVSAIIGWVVWFIFSMIKWGYIVPAARSVIAYFIIGVVLLYLALYSAISRCEITVTDKRVYGKAIWRKRVDLPLDSITAIAVSALNGIAVATSAGSIKFSLIKNNTEIHKTVSNLLIKRQNKEPVRTTIKQEIPQSNADELKKYKDLLDSGVISQEEFNAKKKQLLGL